MNTKHVLLAVLMGLAFACGGKGEEKKPDGKTDVKAPAKEECPKDDPLCDPKFKQAGKEFKIPDTIKDVFYLPAPKQAPKGAAAGTPSVVIFPHKAHATERLKALAEKCGELADINDCTTCHHKEVEKDSAEGFRKCSTCHKAEKDAATGAPASMDAFHTRCIGCHTNINTKCEKAEPKFMIATNCDQCHKAAPTDAGVKEGK